MGWLGGFLDAVARGGLGLVGKGSAGLDRFSAGNATGGFGSMSGVGSGSTWLVVVAVSGGWWSTCGAGITAGLRSLDKVS